MQIQPYLFFDGRCEEAATFYKQAVGAEVLMSMRFKDSPEPAMTPPGSADKIMHMCMKIGDAQVMASDGRCTGKPSFGGFALSVTAADETEAERIFKTLSEGGEVQMPLTKTFFSPKFGMLADKFGVPWMVLVAQ